MQQMNAIWTFLRSLNWRVLFSLPALAVLLGVANNLRVSPDLRVIWSGELPEIAKEAEADDEDAELASGGERHETMNKAGTDVKPGAWTSNFVAATNAAETAHLPVVVVAIVPGCAACVRFHKTLDNEEVKSWQKRLGWYFVVAISTEDKKTLKFVKSTPARNTKPPYVGVYWRRPDGMLTMRNFTAKSGLMGVPAEGTLVEEWMHAVEASVPGAPGSSFAAGEEQGVQVYAAIESEKYGYGYVAMEPESGLIKPGQKVVITARTKHGSEFAGWRYPDGRIVDGGPQLTLDDRCQAGVYKAIFRRNKANRKGKTLKIGGEEE